MSLIAASIGLPLLLKRLKIPKDYSKSQAIDVARVSAAEKAIQAIEKIQHDYDKNESTEIHLYTDAAARLMEIRRLRIDRYRKTAEDVAQFQRIDQIERDIQLAVLRAERDEIYSFGRSPGYQTTWYVNL